MIKVISSTGIQQYSIQDINNEMAGQKALGLLGIPEAWRLPFFVVSKSVVVEFMSSEEDEKKRLCESIAQRIKECVKDFNMLTDKIIIRSSGEEEGMNERGKYESVDCRIEDIETSLYGVLCGLKTQSENNIAYIVQPYVKRKILGHISNERRISQYARDWKVEYEYSEKDPYSIGIRTWRTTYSESELVEDNLQCSGENEIKEELRKVAYYYSQIEKGDRVHLEFVWDGNRIYLVQKDIEVEHPNAINPMEYDIKVNNAGDFKGMKVFRRIDQKDGEKYKKVKNVLMYESLGLVTAPLYILDDKSIITNMSNGVFNEAIEHDFMLFQGKSVVIRTDVATKNGETVQFLPRSNELRSYEDIKSWCIDELYKINSYEEVAILIHMFIPAISAAFSYAEPNSRVVTIQALWGLPEGLYYNAHDTFLLDTGTKNVSHIDEERIMINSIVKDHKAVYISPDEEGKWIEKKVKQPYDWKKSITDKQAKKIARGSRLIAQEVGAPVSIMWFVGIDKEFYETDCLPWFHEFYGNDTFSHDIYKKKYFSETEVVISSEDDLEKYRDDETLKTITIHPKDDKTLRNRDFIGKVGAFAKEKGITIFLEGTILAHPVYALASEGVRIILAKKTKELIEKNNFNKLVRDKIPEKITGNMEQIKCYKTTGNILIRYLKEKLVEEIFEICDATDENNLVEEIADAYEVLQALTERLYENEGYKNIRREKELRGEDGKVIVCAQNKRFPITEIQEQYLSEYGWIHLEMEREHQCIEIEITLNDKSITVERDLCDVDEWKNLLVIFAYQILDEKDRNNAIVTCTQLLEALEAKLKEIKISGTEFMAVRHRKNEKNGGFYNGFVLQETGMRTESPKIDSMFILPYDESSVQEDYWELNELLFDSVTYVDYREKGTQELIVRIKYPLCLDVWQNDFSGKNIEKVFGRNARLKIDIERKGTDYVFVVMVHKDVYEQQSLAGYIDG